MSFIPVFITNAQQVLYEANDYMPQKEYLKVETEMNKFMDKMQREIKSYTRFWICCPLPPKPILSPVAQLLTEIDESVLRDDEKWVLAYRHPIKRWWTVRWNCRLFFFSLLKLLPRWTTSRGIGDVHCNFWYKYYVEARTILLLFFSILHLMRFWPIINNKKTKRSVHRK